uniref:Eukaryotic translation initiation factor 5B n=1 Tax=Anas platyrhynchos platyrhynchos TaxID=8840 RepID=A0A493TV03_ANAPP
KKKKKKNLFHDTKDDIDIDALAAEIEGAGAAKEQEPQKSKGKKKKEKKKQDFDEDDILKELEELSIEAQGGKADREPSAGKVNDGREGGCLLGTSWDTGHLCPRIVLVLQCGWDS